MVVDGYVNDLPKEGCKTCSTGESYVDYYLLCNSKVPLGSMSRSAWKYKNYATKSFSTKILVNL